MQRIIDSWVVGFVMLMVKMIMMSERRNKSEMIWKFEKDYRREKKKQLGKIV